MEKNIFDAMSNKSKPEKDEKRRVPGPVKLPRPPESDRERDLLLQRMNEMKTTLQQQLEEVCSRGKEVNLPMSILTQEVSQLPPAQQEEIRRREKELRDKVQAVVPDVEGGKSGSGNAAEASSAKRGKLRSARNKWIPVK